MDSGNVRVRVENVAFGEGIAGVFDAMADIHLNEK